MFAIMSCRRGVPRRRNRVHGAGAVLLAGLMLGPIVLSSAQQVPVGSGPESGEETPIVLPQIAIPLQPDLPVVIPVVEPAGASPDSVGLALPDILIPEPEIDLALFLPDSGSGAVGGGGQVLVSGRLGGGLFGLLAGSIEVARFGVSPRFRITFDHRSTNAAIAGSEVQEPGTAWFQGADELSLWLNLQPPVGSSAYSAEFTADFASRRRGMQGLGGVYATESRLIAGSAAGSIQPDPLVVIDAALRAADIGRFQALIGSSEVPADGRTDLTVEASAGLDLEALQLGVRGSYELRAARSSTGAPPAASLFRVGARLALNLPIPVLLSGEVDGLWEIGAASGASYPFLVQGTAFLGQTSVVLDGGRIIDLGTELSRVDTELDVRELWLSGPALAERDYWTLGTEIQSPLLEGLDLGVGLRFLSANQLPASGAWDPTVGRYTLESLSGNRFETDLRVAWFAGPSLLLDAGARSVLGERGSTEASLELGAGVEWGVAADLLRLRTDISLPVFDSPEVPILDFQFSLGGSGEMADAPVSAEILVGDVLGLAIPGGRALVGASTEAGLRGRGFSVGLFVDLGL